MAEFPLTWVVVADSARARVFEWASRNADLRELLDLTNSQARLQEQALTSDRPGVGFSSRGQGRRRMQAANTEVDAAAELLAEGPGCMVEGASDVVVVFWAAAASWRVSSAERRTGDGLSERRRA